MESVNTVRTSTVMVSRWVRQWSRIGSINHRIWSVIAPMLFIAFGLFGVNENAWGQLYGKAVGIVSPSNAGQVRVSYDNSTYTGWSTTTATNEGSKGNFLNSSKDFTMAFQANESNEAYDFYGWYDNENGTGTAISTEFNITQNITSSTRNGNNKKNNPATIKRYAVFKAKPVFYFKATATTNNSTYGNAYVTFTESSKTTATTPEATTNCYGTQYNTTSMTKTAYFRAVPETGYVFKGWSTTSSEDDIFNTDKSITYDLTSSSKKSADPASIRYYAIFGEKFAPQITGTASENKEVGDSYTADFSFVNTSSTTPSSSNTADFHYTINQKLSTSVNNGTDVISFDPSTKLITALNAGTATIIFTNKSTTTHQFAEESFTIAVTKKTPTFSCGTSMKVDENLSCTYTNTSANTPTANSSDNFYYEFTNNTPAGNTNGSDTPGAILTFSGNKIYGKNAGTATITFHQKETYKYTGAEKSFNVSVTKHSNTIKVKGSKSYSSSIYVDSYDNDFTFTATNTDYSGSPIQVSQTAGLDLATYWPDQNAVYSSYKLGTATWSVTQPENYKYKAGSGSFTVNVIQQPAEECNVLKNDAEYKFNEMNDNTYVFDAPGDKVTFQIKKYSVATLNQDPVLKGYDVTTGKWVKLHDMSFTTSWEWKTYPINNTNIRKIKWESGGENAWKYIRFVSITRKTYLNIATDNSSTNGTLTINKKSDGYPINPGQTGVANSKIYWSCVDGGDLKIVCENPHFSFSQNTITNTACNNGTTDITVSYTNKEPGTETATVTVYNKMYRQTFTVKGVIEKADQLITWNNDILRLGQSYNNVATANTLVTYESEDESIIRVDEDDEGHKTILTAVGTGTVNITATAEESSFYAEKSDTKSIKVTDKQIQWIDWNQSLFGLKLGGANVTMNAVAASDVEGCVSSRLIEYSSNNESVVKVVNNNQLQIIGVGTAIITAVQAGGFDTDGHDYERAETEKTVIVRDPNAPCESFAYQQGQEVKMECGWNALDKQTRISEINFNGIVPATGTLRYKGEKQTVWPVDYFDGTMTVEQYIQGENWQPVTGGDLGKPAIGTYKTANLTFDRRATKMRVKVTDGLGYHYFTDCQVTQARFIETTAPVDFNLNVGQQQNQVIYLSYSNITDGLSLTLAQGANSHFSVDKSFIEGSCGSAAKNVALTITYHPTAEETNAQDVLTITDGTTSCQVVLTGSATRVNRHINWDHADETNIYTVQTETLSAEARTDLNELAGVVTFSLASSSTATGAISMENVLSFTSAGVANVVAYTTDDARYNAAPNVTKVFNVSKTPTTISTLPVLAAVTSGTAVGDVELTGWQVTNTVNGGVVEGTLAITSADLINVGTNTVTLTFTPDNTDMYVGCTTTTTIVVNKAASVATPSAANIVYGQKVKESELSNEGTEGTWAWNTENNEAVLDAGTHEGLAVHFTPTSGNYTELDATVTLTVEKATPEVTAQASAITYGQAISASELSTATGNISGTWAWAVDTTQVLSVGNHALKANFTSTNANYSDLSNVDVTLTVNKIEKLEVPVALSFCAGGEVTFHGNTYTEAGEYQIEAEGDTRDTVYNVTVTKLQPTTGTDSKTITVGANESWNGIDLSGYAVGSHEVVFHTENVAGCDSTVTLTLTVVPATNIFTNAAGNGDWENPANWQSGSVPSSDPDIIVTGALEVNEDITVGSLTIESTGSVAVISGGTLTVNGTSEDRTEYGDVHVMSDGALALGINADLQVRDFTLDASLGNSSHAATSGQVNGDVNLHINRDAYFQMSFDPRGEIDYGWYDFTVPFEVEVLNGVYDEHMNKLTNGVDYIAMNFNEARRASSGKGWGSFTGTMQPGRIYSIGFDETKTWNTFIFKKKSGSYLLSNGSFTTECSNVGAADDRGWNGLGNGTLQHRELTSLNGEKVQVYNHSEDRYEAYDADEKAYAVGTAFFVQADANMGTIDLTTTDGTKALRAPQYASRALDEFRLTLTAEGEDRYTDRMWVSASEEATGEYVIGHDLLKMGTPKDAKVAQMWTVNNDLRLCDIEMPLINDMSQCPISFFAPQAQTYEIAVDQAPEDATLYLTYNDRIIWSLSASPYTIDLAKGTTEGYGLRIVARHNAPSVATGMDELNVDQDGNRKVLIDNMLYIITPEGAMYSVTGEKVK